MLKKKSIRKPNRNLKESIESFGLRWEEEDDSFFGEICCAETNFDGMNFQFIVTTPEPDENGVYSGLVDISVDVDSLRDKIHYFIESGSLADGQAMCEEFAGAVYAVSEYAELNYEVVLAIARKLDWDIK